MRTNRQRPMRPKPRTRRGVLILVVLGILVLFTMVGVAYVITAGLQVPAAKASAARDMTGNRPDKQLKSVLYQLVRGTRNPNSVMLGGDLLTDLYGGELVRGAVSLASAAQNPVGGQFLEFDVVFSGEPYTDLNASGAYELGEPFIDDNLNGTWTAGAPNPYQSAGYFNGRVLTFTAGAFQGISTRIVGYAPPPTGTEIGKIRVMAPRSETAPQPPSTALNTGDAFVINGRPFDGTGAGFHSSDGELDLTDGDPVNPMPAALLPNLGFLERLHAEDVADSSLTRPPRVSAREVAQGGLDESYDAADFQNPFLAFLLPNADAANDIIPSFHRRALINYMQKQRAGQWVMEPFDNPNFREFRDKVVLRPMLWDHPNFSGGNPAFEVPLAAWNRGPDSGWGFAGIDDDRDGTIDNPSELGWPGSDDVYDAGEDQRISNTLVNGPWDVDNDADLIPDSVWVDAGLAVQTGPDGRQYKPLVAILCVDLDGRLNVNAHGNLSQLQAPPALRYVAGGTDTSGLSRGQGYGPPEIGLGGVFNAGEFQELIAGRWQWDAGSDGGWGKAGIDDDVDGTADNASEAGWPGSDDFRTNQLTPGRYGYAVANVDVPGYAGLDALAGRKLFEYPDNYFMADRRSAFGSPPDLRGRLAFGLDHRGQPVYEEETDADVRVDSPYELNLSDGAARGQFSTASADMPYSAAEMERLLRPFDIDSQQLPDRLWNLRTIDTNGDGFGDRGPLSYDGDAPLNRRLITAESWSVPWVGGFSKRMTSLLEYETANNIDVMPQFESLSAGEQLRLRLIIGSVPEADLDKEVQRMLAPEIVMGLPMDLNRPFGNGRDDNNNGVVDEPAEAALGEPIATSAYADETFDHDNYATAEDNLPPEQAARHVFARHLYVLAMLLKSPGVEIDFNGDGQTSPAETAQGLAQWAINVVDFRDADSIMTPFEYDVDPFDGWQVDGNLATTGDEDRGVVWGSERPEMLITETLAWHDRRTEDLTNYSRVDSQNNPDEDFDQRLVPIGPLFIELYNPWASSDGFNGANYDGRNAIKLDEIHVEGSPKWRLLIVKGISKEDDPDDLNNPLPAGDIDRSIYFAEPLGITGHGQAYHTSLSGILAPLLPGRFAVVGSGLVSTVGRLDTDTRLQETVTGLNTGSTRQIGLMPDSNPANNQFEIRNNDVPAPEPLPADMQPVVAVPIDLPRPVSISEPRGGYITPPGHLWDPAAADGEGAYTPPIHHPFDLERAKVAGVIDPDRDESALWTDGTTANYRTIHLQRLANPMQAWNPVTNPYLTIDSASVDLTAFNGVPPEAGGGSQEPEVLPRSVHFRTHQRGDQYIPNLGQAAAATPPERNLWTREPAHDKPLPRVPLSKETDPHVFKYVLQHTLGYLNEEYAGRNYQFAYNQADAAALPSTGLLPANHYVGAPDTITPHPTTNRPAPPFPWLTWNNRPFVGAEELMLVPRGRSSRLLEEFTTDMGAANGALVPRNESPYESPTNANDNLPVPFGHLPNFFESKEDDAARLYRILEHVRVPSRFVGTETFLNPGPSAFGSNDPAAAFFHPPFNQVAEYRDPGKVNVNTIAGTQVWEGGFLGRRLTDPTKPWNPTSNSYDPNTGHPGPDWQTLVASRRGYDGNAILDPKDGIPTFFANPFRSSSAAELVPLDSMKRPGIEATLLRSNAIDQTDSPGNEPLFGRNSDAAHSNTKRNAYFRYQGMQRVSNLLTMQSNVYAVWITIGYFEVQPVPVSATHPDGFRLGAEIGSDTGEIERHRAFFIVDRSIPVAAEPGEDHNVENTIRLQRFIE